MCFLPNVVVNMGLQCAWNNQDGNSTIKQIFMLREPTSRALSVYYFWGELFKLKKAKAENKKSSINVREKSLNLGSVRGEQEITRLFRYHGQESTVPSEEIAMAFASKLPYNKGMPGGAQPLIS